MNKLLQSKIHICGFSMVELLVAMCVSLMLVASTASVYLASKRSYLEIELMARMSQNGRFALHMVSESIIHAGFTGELPMENITPDNDLSTPGSDCSDTAAIYDIEHYLVAEISTTASVFGCIDDAMPNTSALIVKNVRPMKLVDSDDNGTIDNPEGILAENTYVIANNSRGFLFHGSDTTPPSITEDPTEVPSDSEWVPGGSAWIYQMQIYYIRDDGSGTPQLARKVLLNGALAPSENLVEGVENMSFLFGLDTNADGEIDTYSTATNVHPTSWNDISSIQLNLLVRSDETDVNYTDTKVYSFGGLAANIGPFNDNFHRIVMQTTISLRNPIFVIRGI